MPDGLIIDPLSTPVSGPLSVTPVYAAGDQLVWWDGLSWQALPSVTGGAVTEAPADGTSYGRQNGTWTHAPKFVLATINANLTPAIINPLAGALLTLQQADGAQANSVQMNGFGAGGQNSLNAFYASGTAAAPTALAGQRILSIHGRGYDGALWTTAAARIDLVPLAVPWTPGDHSTQIVFSTTPVGSTTIRQELAIGPGLTVGTPGAPAGGMQTGDINAANRVMINGVPISAGTGGGISEAPSDGTYYVRRNAAWVRPDDTYVGGIIAGGLTQASATQLTAQFNVISGGTAPGSGLNLPAGSPGRRCGVKNAWVNPIQVFPRPGDGARINTFGIDAVGGIIQPDEMLWFEAESLTQWHA